MKGYCVFIQKTVGRSFQRSSARRHVRRFRDISRPVKIQGAVDQGLCRDIDVVKPLHFYCIILRNATILTGPWLLRRYQSYIILKVGSAPLFFGLKSNWYIWTLELCLIFTYLIVNHSDIFISFTHIGMWICNSFSNDRHGHFA